MFGTIRPGPIGGSSTNTGTSSSSVVDSTVVSGPDVIQVQLTGLDINTDKGYRLAGCIAMETAMSCDFYLRINGSGSNIGGAFMNYSAAKQASVFEIDILLNELDGEKYVTFGIKINGSIPGSPYRAALVVDNVTTLEIVAVGSTPGTPLISEGSWFKLTHL